ncbi:MAG: energy transducer TonB [Flavobacteriaceae bacterium]
MELKKNPKADLNRDIGLFFVIGLTVVLLATWLALEHKTYPKEEYVTELINVAEDLKENVPVTEAIKTPPPPPPPAAPEVIEIVEDEAEIEETIIESTEISQETVIDAPVAVEDVEVEDIEEEVTVPFAIIENVPIFPGCEYAKGNDERKACFQKMIQQHVKENFKYPDIALELGTQGKVYVQFAIDSKGKIVNIKTRGPDRNLEMEASRIIASLPQMTPGMQRGRAVTVPYSIPVTFKLE